MKHRRSIPVPFFSLAILLLSAASVFAQTATTWNRPADIRNGVRGTMVGTVTARDATRSFTLSPDREASGRVTVFTDVSSTLYTGFGANDSRETFRGSAGFSKLQIGDRLEIRGTGTSQNAIAATDIILLGRSHTIGAGGDSIEGLVRQVSARDSRLVIETTNREMLTILGSSTTPVYFRGEVYRITNIEVGDRVRVDVDTTTRDGVRATAIDVLSSVSEPGTPGGDQNAVTTISGKVTRLDTRTQTFRVNRQRSQEVRVDTRQAYDANGRRFDLTGLKNGDEVEVSGQFVTDGTFRADTIRMTDGSDDEYDDDGDAFTTIVIYGTVEQTLASSDNLIVRDTTSRRLVTLELVDDFIVRLKSGTYVTADQLKKGDRLVIQAFVIDDRFVAQTIRTR